MAYVPKSIGHCISDQIGRHAERVEVTAEGNLVPGDSHRVTENCAYRGALYSTVIPRITSDPTNEFFG